MLYLLTLVHHKKLAIAETNKKLTEWKEWEEWKEWKKEYTISDFTTKNPPATQSGGTKYTLLHQKYLKNSRRWF